MPEMRNVRCGPTAWMRIESPTAKPWFAADALSITTWSPPCGHEPDVSCVGLNC